MRKAIRKHKKEIISAVVTGTIALGGGAYISNKIEPSAVYAMASATNRETDIVIRVGEYLGKPGKRIYCDNINWNRIPKDLPIRQDEDGRHYIAEFDINNKIATRLHAKLEEKGANVKIIRSSSKATDLNAAGRASNKFNPYVYFSVHTNYFDRADASGYFMMHNAGDKEAQIIAQRLSDSIKNNSMIKQAETVAQNGYIGELNVIHDSTTGVLFEGGFYSGTEGNGDLYHIVSDEYSDYIADKLSDELIKIVNEKKYN